MDKEALKKDFLSKEIALQLHNEIPTIEYERKIKVLTEYTESVKSTVDADVLYIKYQEHVGFFYWHAGEYSRAIPHFENALDRFHSTDYPSLYLLIIRFLITCNRYVEDYEEAFRWFNLALDNLVHTDSSFEKLRTLTEYIDLLSDSGESFDIDTGIITEIIEDLGFPEKLTDPVETINSLRNTHHIWNRKLSEIVLMDDKDEKAVLEAYQEYAATCPIGWYREYVKDIIDSLQNAG